MTKKKANTQNINAHVSIVKDAEIVDNNSVTTSASTDIHSESDEEAKIANMDYNQLYSLLQCVKNVCARYENTLKNYDGTIAQNTYEYRKFQYYNHLHMLILDAIEMKIESLS